MKLQPMTWTTTLQLVCGSVFSVICAPAFFISFLFPFALQGPHNLSNPFEVAGMYFLMLIAALVSVSVLISVIPLWYLTLFGTEQIKQRRYLKWWSIVSGLPTLAASVVLLPFSIVGLLGLVLSPFTQPPTLLQGQILLAFLFPVSMSLLLMWQRYLSSLFKRNQVV